MQYISGCFHIVIEANGEVESANQGSNALSQLNKYTIGFSKGQCEKYERMGGVRVRGFILKSAFT